MEGLLGFTEAQKMFQHTVRDFAQKELSPGAKERAKLDHTPPEIIKKIADMGLLRLRIPPEYGGELADWIMVGIAFEEIARVDISPILPILCNIIAPLMLEPASEEVKAEWLPVLGRGEKLCCFAITEPDCGSDAAAIKTSAIRDGDSYVLSGEKTSISLAMQADCALLSAKTDPKTGTRGISCFIVPLDAPGVTRSRYRDMGCHPLGRGSITLDEARVPAKYLLGEEGKGFYSVMDDLDFARPVVALMNVGLAQASLDDAIAYARQRTAFGQPIGRFEGVSLKLAEDATLIDASRLLCYRALWLREQGIAYAKEAAMCKWFATEASVRVIHDALLTFGHVGYSDEYPIEQRLRDAIGMEIGDGTPEIMKLIIVREILGREFLPY
jgi:cyclohexanecarboxyl-CoA dehydrogenase